MLLNLIRHGETLRNRLGVIMGHSPAPLSDRGRLQAARLADAIRHIPFDAIYASDLERAAETASIAFGGRPVHLTEAAGTHPGQTVAVVTHGGPVRSLVAHLLGIPITQPAPFEYDNCAITVVEWGEKPRLRTWNWMPEPGGTAW